MDELVELVAVIVGMGGVAWLADRVLRGEGPPGWPIGAISREEFWRRSLPWPRGIQEDDEIAWHVPRSAAAGMGAPSPRRGRPAPPTRPQPRTRPTRD
jgi:hypothetical protein